MHRHVTAALAVSSLCGCPPPPTEIPEAPPVVEVSSRPSPSLEPEEDAAEPEAPTPDVAPQQEDVVSDEDAERQQEVADALASLTATSPGGVPSAGWGTGSVVGVGGIGGGGWGMGHGAMNGPHVSVAGNDTKVRGPLSKEVIRRIIRSNLAAYKHCYQEQLLKDPDLSGKVVVRFVISKSGAVAHATIAEGLEDELDRCVRNVAIRMMFPKPEGGGIVVVNYPFVFQSASGP